MRSITLQAFGAFESDLNWSSSNTRVESNGKTTDMYLLTIRLQPKILLLVLYRLAMEIMTCRVQQKKD